MAKFNTKIGDIFSVKVDDEKKKYFQYIVSDLTQLNSDVIRTFKKVYSINANPDCIEIINGEVEFYAHCVTKIGVKLGYWEKAGNIAEVGNFKNVLFKDTEDYGTPTIEISQSWWIWRINEKQRRVGELEGENRKAEIGIVISPDSIIHRMQTGKYDFVYPRHE